MRIKKETIEAEYEFSEINQDEYDTLRLAFRRALDFYWQYGTYHQRATGDTPYKGEMDKIELLAKKFEIN